MMKLHKIKVSLFLNFISISIIFSFFIVCGSSSKSDNNSLSNIPVDVYVGGNAFINNRYVAVYWKNGEIVPLSTKHSTVTSLAIAGNDIYAGGYIIKYDPSIPSQYEVVDIALPGYWKNGEWVGLSVLDPKKGSSVETIFINGDDVYACGYSTNRSGTKVAGYWKNKKWVGLDLKKVSSVKTIFINGDDIYACGYMREEGILIPGYWKNTEWFALPSLSERKIAYVDSIFVSGNNVYVCGYSKNNLGINIACYWKNSEIIPLPSNLEYSSTGVSIFVSGKDIYVGGYQSNIYYTPLASQIAGYWKNREWVALKPFDDKENSEVSSIFVFGNDVYASGYSRSNGINIPGYWKNGEWIGFNVDAGSSPVTSIVVVPRP